LLEYY